MAKTIRIRQIIDEVNRRNKMSLCSPEIRQGWNAMLEQILFDTKNYNGFSYLTKDEVPEGQKPGIIRDEGNMPASFPDGTRRVYFYPK